MELIGAKYSADILRLSDTSRLQIVHAVYKNNGVPTTALPQYVEKKQSHIFGQGPSDKEQLRDQYGYFQQTNDGRRLHGRKRTGQHEGQERLQDVQGVDRIRVEVRPERYQSSKPTRNTAPLL